MRALIDVTPSPDQLPILADDRQGFRLIRGAAGSGKTTAALLRLRQLCGSRLARQQRLNLVDPVRVLALTFNRTLRGYIEELAEDVGSSEGLDVSIETFAGWARGLVGADRLVSPAESRARIGDLLSGVGIAPQELEYFTDEVEYVRGRFPVDRTEEYLRATRSGRGRAPAVPQRLRGRLLAEVVGPYNAGKAARREQDWTDVALAAAGANSGGYDVVVVDESQDLSANQIRAVLAHLKKDHATTFIIDAVQRIYPQGFQWRELGIEMRPEMVFALRRNHRNTREIARFAASLVHDLPVEEDGLVPDAAACERTGAMPEVVAGSFSGQIAYMLREVREPLASGETVAILHPKGGGWFAYVKETLVREGIAYCELTRQRAWPKGPELVALSTIHSAKGLEFDHVLIPGLSQQVTRHGTEEGDGTLESLRRLVAMGIGRARNTVRIGYKPLEESTLIGMIDPRTFQLVGV